MQLGLSIVFGFLPSVGQYWSMARGIDPLGQAKFSFSPDGRSLKLEGVIGMGDGERLRQLLDSEAAKELKRVELVSPGGRVREAERMASAREGPWPRQPRRRHLCQRLHPGLFGRPAASSHADRRAGFSTAPSTGTYNPVFEELANQQLAKTYTELGLPQPMIDKTLRTPSRSMWFVPREELLSYALIAPSPRTLAVPLPDANAKPTDLNDVLHMHPVWEALGQAHAGGGGRGRQAHVGCPHGRRQRRAGAGHRATHSGATNAGPDHRHRPHPAPPLCAAGDRAVEGAARDPPPTAPAPAGTCLRDG